MLNLDRDSQPRRILDRWLVRGDRRERPLACLQGDVMTARVHAWHGRSGRRYLVTVYPVDHDDPAVALPDLGQAVLIAVARHGAARVPLGMVAIERASDWSRAVTRLHAGVDEWHVHLLASDRAARGAVLADLGAEQRIADVA